MNSKPIKSTDILALERQVWDAMKAGDVDSAVALTKFPCTMTGPKGVQSVTEPQFRKMMAGRDGTRFAGIELENPQVVTLGADSAFITYQVDFSGKKMLDTSTWVNDAGAWRCAVHSEHPLG